MNEFEIAFVAAVARASKDYEAGVTGGPVMAAVTP